ncbi:MAG TPA: outer membrane beta-barrel protein, partial [Thermoanaerobaculia bacterium]|nr:outer membrane beta-barrel protein [Thermoanaerobaculia bacterium]
MRFRNGHPGRSPRFAWTALVSLFLSGLASAQALPGSVEIGAGGGRFYGGSFAKGTTRAFSREVEVDDDIAKGFWLGAQWNRRWGVEVAVRRSTENLVIPQSGVFPNEPATGTIDIATIEVLAVRSFPHGRFAPYVALGGGVTNLDINVPDRNVRDVNRFGAAAGVGAKFHALPWVGFRVDARFRATYLGKRSVDDGG